MKYRIRKYDSLNWTTEVWGEGGKPGRGATAGRESQAKWRILGYHPDPAWAAKSLLKDALLDPGEVVQLDAFAKRFSEAEEYVLSEARRAMSEALLAKDDSRSLEDEEAS